MTRLPVSAGERAVVVIVMTMSRNRTATFTHPPSSLRVNGFTQAAADLCTVMM